MFVFVTVPGRPDPSAQAFPARRVRSRRAACAMFVALALQMPAAIHVAQAQSAGPGAQTEEMARAIAKARQSLDVFWRRVRANDPADTGYAVKVIAGDQHGSEHLWLSNITLRSGRILGMVDTQPRVVRSIRQGQVMDVRDDAIVDWMYFENGRIVGNETGRAMLRYLPAAEREKMLQLYK